MSFASFVHLMMFIIFVSIGGLLTGKSIEYVCNFKNQKKYYIVYWLILISLLSIALLFRTIWSTYIFYIELFLLLYNIIIIIFMKLKKDKVTKILKNNIWIIFLISGLLLSYGYLNAKQSTIKTYDITINNLKEDSIICFASDIHLGTSDLSLIDDLVEDVNQIYPDVLVLGGDYYDENTKEEYIEEYIKKLSSIKTKYGIIYIEGNHDLLTDKVKYYMESNNIIVLEDEYMLINNNYYLIGRRDNNDELRKNLSTIVSNLDSNIPRIVLDHQPNTKELKENNIDLQVSGHTHGGQLWPLNYFVKKGYYPNDNLIVSYGYGVWNNPVRTSGHQELVVINLKNS